MQDSEGGCHVVHMREAVPFRNHLCISFELLSINLYDYIKANQFKGSSLRLIRSASAQPHSASKLPTVTTSWRRYMYRGSSHRACVCTLACLLAMHITECPCFHLMYAAVLSTVEDQLFSQQAPFKMWYWCRKFATQVLICLRFLRCQRVLHCDLKPENILLAACDDDRKSPTPGIRLDASVDDSATAPCLFGWQCCNLVP